MVTNRLVGGWILDVDIRKFFDMLDHARLRELLQRRIPDGVLRVGDTCGGVIASPIAR